MMQRRSFLLLGSSFLVQGCGGSSGGGSAPMPTPTPTPSPAPSPTPPPTPTPTPTSNASLSTLVASEVFPVALARIGFSASTTGASSPNSNFLAFGGGSTFSYALATDTFTLALGSETSPANVGTLFDPPICSPAQLTATSATLRTWSSGISSNPSGPVVNTFSLYRNGQTAQLLLNYVSYGIQDARAQVSSRDTFYISRTVIHGVQTPAAAIPATGTVGYTSIIDGRYLSQQAAGIGGQPQQQLVGGTATVSVNWTSGVVTITLALTGTDVAGTVPPVPTLGTWTGTATIASGSNRFAGTIGGNGFTGDVSGAIFGPTANEIGFAVRGLRTRPRNFPPPDTSTATDGVALAVVGRV
jgi:hypothetical protein